MKKGKHIILLLITLLTVFTISVGVCLAVPFSVAEASFNYRYNGSLPEIQSYASVKKGSEITTYAYCAESSTAGSTSGPTVTLNSNYYTTAKSNWLGRGNVSWIGYVFVTGSSGGSYAWGQ